MLSIICSIMLDSLSDTEAIQRFSFLSESNLGFCHWSPWQNFFKTNWANCFLCHFHPNQQRNHLSTKKARGFHVGKSYIVKLFPFLFTSLFRFQRISIQPFKVSPWVWWRSVQTDKLATSASFEGRWSATATQVFRRESHLKRRKLPEQRKFLGSGFRSLLLLDLLTEFFYLVWSISIWRTKASTWPKRYKHPHLPANLDGKSCVNVSMSTDIFACKIIPNNLF